MKQLLSRLLRPWRQNATLCLRVDACELARSIAEQERDGVVCQLETLRKRYEALAKELDLVRNQRNDVAAKHESLKARISEAVTA